MCIYIYMYIYIYMDEYMYVCIYIYRESLQQSHSLRAGSPNPFSSMIDPIFHKRFFHSYVKSPAFFMTLHLCFYVYSCVKKTCWRLAMPCHALAQGGAGRRRSTKPLLWSFHPSAFSWGSSTLHLCFRQCLSTCMPRLDVELTAWFMVAPCHGS